MLLSVIPYLKKWGGGGSNPRQVPKAGPRRKEAHPKEAPTSGNILNWKLCACWWGWGNQTTCSDLHCVSINSEWLPCFRNPGEWITSGKGRFLKTGSGWTNPEGIESTRAGKPTRKCCKRPLMGIQSVAKPDKGLSFCGLTFQPAFVRIRLDKPNMGRRVMSRGLPLHMYKANVASGLTNQVPTGLVRFDSRDIQR